MQRLDDGRGAHSLRTWSPRNTSLNLLSGVTWLLAIVIKTAAAGAGRYGGGGGTVEGCWGVLTGCTSVADRPFCCA